jgi:hypothetical protein
MNVETKPASADARQQHVRSRLVVLQTMALRNRLAPTHGTSAAISKQSGSKNTGREWGWAVPREARHSAQSGATHRQQDAFAHDTDVVRLLRGSPEEPQRFPLRRVMRFVKFFLILCKINSVALCFGSLGGTS